MRAYAVNSVMRISVSCGSVLLALAMVMGAGCASAQSASASSAPYPNKPIRIVVTGVGSGGDFAARIIAAGVSVTLGQQIIVDNRTSGTAPGEIVSKAPPDGYTLCLSAAPLWIGPFLQKTSYDPVKDFAPVTLAVTSPNILVVPAALPAKSVKELIVLIKAKPGELNYASGPTGNANHLAAELFNYMAGVNIVRVAYKGTPQAVNDVIAGHVQITFNNAAGSVPHVKSGRLRGLAVTGVERSALLPDLPTVAASGLPGYESGTISGMWTPAGTPVPVVDRLYRETVRILARPDVKERFFNTGIEATGKPPADLAVAMKTDMARMEKLIKALGIRVE